VTFIQSFALWGLLLAFAPLIIHLLNLLRHRSEPWAATQFLLQARKSSSRMSKIRKWLTLLFRVLALSCLTIAIARPISGGDYFLSFSSQNPDVLVCILDRSASMETISGKSTLSKRELALEAFREFLKPWPESKLVLVDTVYEEPCFIENFESLNEKNYGHLIGGTETAASLTGTILKTLNWMEETQIGSAEVLIASDMQRSNWIKKSGMDELRRIDRILKEKKDLWTIKIIPFYSSPPNNLSVQIDEVRRNEDTLIPSIILNQNKTSGLSGKVDLIARINGDDQPFSIGLKSNLTKWNPKFDLNQKTTVGWGSIQLIDDYCNSDNQCFFTYNKKSSSSVAVRASNPEIGVILRSAAQNQEGKTADYLSRQSVDSEKMSSFKVIIHQGGVTKSDAEKFEEFTKNGGTLILFPSEQSKPLAFSFLNWGRVETKGKTNYHSIRNWSKENCVLENFTDGSPLPLDYLSVYNRRIPSHGEPLAYYRDGKTFLSKFTLGNGLVYAFSTLPIDSWSSLKDGFILVPAIQRIIENSSSLSSTSGIICGSEESKELFEYECVDQPGQKIPSLNAGVYKVNDQLIAVNRPETENDTDTLSLPELDSLLPNTESVEKLNSNQLSSLKRSEIWTSFLFLCLAFLVGEAALGLPSKPRMKN
jgi:hypothetical protein